jgi:hypothetical protein
MGNHEFPCLVCGENKFGLSGCDERYHSEAELDIAISDYTKDRIRALKNKQRHYANNIARNIDELESIKKYKFGQQ